MEDERFGVSIEERNRLVGAVIIDVEKIDGGIRYTLQLKDGAILRGDVSHAEEHYVVFGGVPLLTNVEITEATS